MKEEFEIMLGPTLRKNIIENRSGGICHSYKNILNHALKANIPKVKNGRQESEDYPVFFFRKHQNLSKKWMSLVN